MHGPALTGWPYQRHAGDDYGGFFSYAGVAVVIDGIVLLWFILTALALLFVALDIRSTPESPVLKWGFVLVTGYIGVFGAFLYVLGCREPFPGTHERYVSNRWRQVLGSTMHCVAGDGVGILVGAAISSTFSLRGPGEIVLEYVLGFAFGWTVFQALFMRDMAGGSYARSLSSTFIPELLSMNLLMAGMVPIMMVLQSELAPMAGAASPVFWFVMSMALLAGFIIAYPMNWWLVANNLKHGMMTVRPAGAQAQGDKEMPGDAIEPGPSVLAGSDPAHLAPPMADARTIRTLAAMRTAAEAHGDPTTRGETEVSGGTHGHAGHAAMTGAAEGHHMTSDMASDMDRGRGQPVPSVLVMTLLSFLALAVGIAIAEFAAPMAPM